MGAIATCPLEVVKTRLQSSHFVVMMANLPPAAASRHKNSTTCPTLPPHRRLCTSAIRNSASQVVHLSHNMPPNPRQGPRTLSLLHCLRYFLTNPQMLPKYGQWKVYPNCDCLTVFSYISLVWTKSDKTQIALFFNRSFWKFNFFTVTENWELCLVISISKLRMENYEFPSTYTVISIFLDDIDNSKQLNLELCQCCSKQAIHLSNSLYKFIMVLLLLFIPFLISFHMQL